MFGHHCTKNGRTMDVALVEECDRVRETGVVPTCMQIFVMGPKSMNETLKPAEKKALMRVSSENDITLVTHSAYVNHPWVSPRGRGAVLRELRISHTIGSIGVVIHLSSHVAKNEYAAFIETIEYFADKLDDEAKQTQTLWLEVNAAKPSPWTFEKPEAIRSLMKVLKSIDTKGLKVGVCVDTAHLAACGTALVTSQDMEKWFVESMLIRPIRGRGKSVHTREYRLSIPIMLHLNDLATPVGSGKDIHECLGKGSIWGEVNKIEISGLKWLTRFIVDHGIITILERNINLVQYDYCVLKPIIDRYRNRARK